MATKSPATSDTSMENEEPAVTPAGLAVEDEAAAGWGETIDQGTAPLPAFQKTAIENNTSAGLVAPEQDRFQSTDDVFVKILTSRSLESVALEGHFSAQDAKRASEALKALFGKDRVEVGNVVAMRG